MSAGDWTASIGESAETGAGSLEFEEIVRRHEHQVFGLARWLLRRPEDAEDAAQEAFFRLYQALYRSRGRFDPKRPLAPYLHRLTVNVCKDLGRRRGRFRATPLDEMPEAGEPAAKDPSPEAAAALAEDRRIAAAALATLPIRQRAALVLRDVQGLSTREVAEALGVREVTVRTQISRARLKVREFRDRRLEWKETPS